MAEGRYAVIWGKGDASEWMDCYIDLTDEEENDYERAIKLRLPFDDFPSLQDALDRARDELEFIETENAVEIEDSFALECLGRLPVEADDINALVAARDAHTLEFFGLTELSEEELNGWDANSLEKLPEICDFEEGFEPMTPFEAAWDLRVEFAEDIEEEALDEVEARETVAELLEEANGDFETLNDYVERCEDYYCGEGTLKELAVSVAEELGIAWGK